jgi:hypothetical protein
MKARALNVLRLVVPIILIGILLLAIAACSFAPSYPPRSSGEATVSLQLMKSRLEYGRHRVWFLDDRVVLEFRVEQAARTY